MPGIPARPPQPVVLVVRSEGHLGYSVSKDGAVLSCGWNALAQALWLLQMDGICRAVPIIVRNADTGAQSEPFTLNQRREMWREDRLPLPVRKRRRGQRIVRNAAEREAVVDVTDKPANLPPLRGRSGVWVDQRAKSRTNPAV